MYTLSFPHVRGEKKGWGDGGNVIHCWLVRVCAGARGQMESRAATQT